MPTGNYEIKRYSYTEHLYKFKIVKFMANNLLLIIIYTEKFQQLGKLNVESEINFYVNYKSQQYLY